MDRGQRLLYAIYDDVDHALNPDGDECWHCGGTGATYDCIDGCCENAAEGCAICERRCPECMIHEKNRAKAVREAVIKSGDVELAAAWLKSVGRWSDGITIGQIGAELDDARRRMETPEG